MSFLPGIFRGICLSWRKLRSLRETFTPGRLNIMVRKKDSGNDYTERFCREIGRREARKLRERRRKGATILSGLGVFGVVGWSVVIPALLGVALGLWVDSHWPGRISWTITLLLCGLALGCLNAWYWITKERKKIDEDRKFE